MNDELLHMVLTAAYGNAFLARGENRFPTVPDPRAARFVPAGAETLEGEAAWFKHLSRRGCQELAFAFDYGAEDWTRTAFPNGVPGWSLACRYEAKTTLWRRYWENRLADGSFQWYAAYTEDDAPAAAPPSERIGAQARFEHLQAMLGMLAQLSGAVRAYEWKARFTALHNDMDYFRSRKLIEASMLPRAYSDEARKLFTAACYSWVFGGMGSWNDEPQALAAAAGMETMYNDLTGELYTALLGALRCAVGMGNIEA